MSTPQGPELYLDLAGQQKLCYPLGMSSRHGRELHALHRDMFTLQRHVLFLEVSTPQGPELHLDVNTLQRPVLHLNMSTPQGPELHLDLSTPQEPELHLGCAGKQKPLLFQHVSTLQRPVLHSNMSTHWGLSCTSAQVYMEWTQFALLCFCFFRNK